MCDAQGFSKGFGFVAFLSSEDAARAVSCNEDIVIFLCGSVISGSYNLICIYLLGT